MPIGHIKSIDHKTLLSVLDELDDSLFILSHDWKFLYANATALDRFKASGEAILGRNIWTHYTSLDQTPLQLAARKTMADKRQREVEDYYAFTGRWYRSKIIPSKSGVIIHGTDVTEKKQITDMNKSLILTLEQALDMGASRKKDQKRPESTS